MAHRVSACFVGHVRCLRTPDTAGRPRGMARGRVTHRILAGQYYRQFSPFVLGFFITMLVQKRGV